MAQSDTDDSVLARWHSIIQHPLEYKWRLLEIVGAVIFTTTIAFFWSRIMKDVLDIDKVIS